jgi:hypothetical protein
MNRLRANFIRLTFVFLTGLSFLNMGFALLEVNLLHIDKELSIGYGLNNFGAEEEEQGGESSQKEQGKEIDLHVADHLCHHMTLLSNARIRQKHLYQTEITAGFASKFSPPPEKI